MLDATDPARAQAGLGVKTQALMESFNGLLARVAGLTVLQAVYDFAVKGGAQGDIALGTIPAGTIILGGVVKVLTPLGSGGSATAALKAEAANDLVNAAAISGAPWSTAGRKSVIPVFTGVSSVETTVARSLSLTVATADLNAGKFVVTLFCVPNAVAADALVAATLDD